METLFNYVAVDFLIPTVETLAIFVYLAVLPEKKTSTRLIACVFFFYFCYSFGHFLFNSFFTPRVLYANYLVGLIVFANCFFIALLYRLGGDTYPRENRIITGVAFISGIVTYLYYILKTCTDPGMYIFGTLGFAFKQQANSPLSLALLLSHLWMIILPLRKARLLAKIRPAHAHIDRNIRALRSFGSLTGLTLLFALSYFLAVWGIINFSIYESLISLGLPLVLFLYCLIYINNSEQTAGFMIRVCGISLMTVFLLIAISGRLLRDLNEEAFNAKIQGFNAETAQILKTYHTNPGGFITGQIPEAVAYILALPGPGHSWTLLYTGEDAPAPEDIIRAEKRETAEELSGYSARLIQTRHTLETGNKERAAGNKKVRAKPGRRYRYLNLNDPRRYYLGEQIVLNGRTYEIGYSYLKYRRNVHRAVKSQVYMVLLATLLLLLIFPLFFRRNLTNPLNRLLNAIKSAESGRLETNIPISMEDEIGSLTRSFNRMLRALLLSRRKLKQYALTLEKRVRERTARLSSALEDLKKRDHRMRQELSMARDIQQNLLPPTSLRYKNLSLLSYYGALEEVGGDYFDFFRLEDNRLGIVIADGSGHGLPAALLTAMARISFPAASRRGQTPAGVLKLVNQALLRALKAPDYYMTALLIILEKDLSFSYAGAAHPCAYLLRKSAGSGKSTQDEIQIQELESTGMLLGSLAQADDTYQDKWSGLLPADRLFLYTDGLTEARNRAGEEFGEKRLQEILRETAGTGARETREKILQNLKVFQGAEPRRDDLTFMILDVHPEQTRNAPET